MCGAIGQPCSTQRQYRTINRDEEALRSDIVKLARQCGHYGYRRITAVLRRDAWQVNHKAVERIWRQEGVKVSQKQPKRTQLWFNDGFCVRLRPMHRNHVCSYDFMVDRRHDGRANKILTVIDEYTREALVIIVTRKITSDDVRDCLTDLCVTYGPPEHIRSDNGSEFTAKAVKGWLGLIGVKTLLIDLASPWENRYNESFNGKLRDELFNREIFYTLGGGSGDHRKAAAGVQYGETT